MNESSHSNIHTFSGVLTISFLSTTIPISTNLSIDAFIVMSNITLDKTNLKNIARLSKVNLERSMTAKQKLEDI